MDNGTIFPKDSSCQGLETDILTCALGTFGEDSSLWPFRHQSGSSSFFMNCLQTNKLCILMLVE